MSTLSSRSQLRQMQRLLQAYLRLPPPSSTVSGALMEALVAHVHRGRVLRTYDFVDVIDERNARGWQVKSTKAATPVTWKRAKLANIEDLINASHSSDDARQELGDAILNFCNKHAVESLTRYRLDEIGYARLVVDEDHVRYFERPLIQSGNLTLFEPRDFTWHWPDPKTVTVKEQLPALHGVHRVSGTKWWAWHGKGENQLHFSGEKEWWPQPGSWAFRIPMPSADEQVSFDALVDLLETKLPSH